MKMGKFDFKVVQFEKVPTLVQLIQKQDWKPFQSYAGRLGYNPDMLRNVL